MASPPSAANMKQSPEAKGSRHKRGRSPDSCPGSDYKENSNVEKKVKGSPSLAHDGGKGKPNSTRGGHHYRGGKCEDWAFGKAGMRAQDTLREEANIDSVEMHSSPKGLRMTSHRFY